LDSEKNGSTSRLHAAPPEKPTGEAGEPGTPLCQKKETSMKRLITILLTVTALNFSLIPYVCAEGPKGKTKAAKDTRTESAKKVMKNVRQLANVFEESGHLVVEFHEYLFPYDINKRLQFVRAVADADCVLTGKPRLIFYYNPDGKQIAQADPSNGIKLK